MDLETARANMVEQQIRPWQVLEAQTLDALRRIRREDFVPPAHRHLAFADTQIPLQSAAPTDGAAENADERAVMLEPKVTARMAEALNLSRDDRALLIGAGGGYTAALLATLAAHVTAVDIDPALLRVAKRNLAAAGIDNVALQTGDAHAGWGAAESFDAIFISGSLPTVDDSWTDALTDGGRLVGIEGHAPAMRVLRLTKHGGGGGDGGGDGDGDCRATITRESLFETVAPRLRGAAEPARFQF
ncbi:MAG: protein-L-isoaspartate O-methyltransferase [Gammaproteobacteria bacterium]|nr:protein-L-isoaspartate O-methyltransferase [Gammaproteobacteria bacterium]